MKHDYNNKSVQPYLNLYSLLHRIKSTIILSLTTLLLSICGPAFAQQNTLLEKKINVKLTNVSLIEALNIIGGEAGCTFSYSNKEIDASKVVNENFNQIAVKELIYHLLGTNARLQLSGQQIFIQFGTERGTIKGTVKTSDGQPAEFVTVGIKGLSSTIVDKNGKFSLKNIPAGNHKIIASYVGLVNKSQQVTVKKDEVTTVALTLEEDRETLKEVVINSRTGKKKYTAQLATVGSKFPVPLKDIPNSVSVITRQIMDDQNMITLSDAMNQATGITAMPYGDGTYYFQSRGYASDIQYDGLPANNGIQYIPQFDLAMYDRVEILRGSAGLLQGSGSAAGVVNLARKRPLDQFGIAGALFAGSWNNFKGNLDVSTPIDKAGKLKGRFVLSGEDKDYFYDKAHSKRGLGYAILEYQASPNTTVTLSGSSQGEKMGPFDYGVGVRENGSFINAPRSSFFGTDWSNATTYLNEIYAEAVHKFSDQWQARVTVDYRDMSTNSSYGYVSSRVNTDNIARYASQLQKYALKWAGVDANVTGSFNLFGRTHQLVAGVNYAYRNENSKSGFKNYPGIDIFNINVPHEDLPFTYGAESDIIQYGLYAQTRLKVLEPLTLVLGGRLSNYRSKTKALVPTIGDWKDDPNVNGQFTPYAGLVYNVNKQLSLYTSFSNVFAAQTQLMISGAVLKPRKGNQFEAGIKGSFFNDELNASLAAFNIKDNNRAITDPVNPNFYVANGEVRSRGIEAEVSGSPVKGLNIYSGYTYLETKYITDPTNQGEIFDAETPKHTFKLWSNYDFQNGFLKNANLGFGARAVSDANRGAAVQKGYAVFNAQAGYHFFKKWSLTFTLNNIFDRKYYARIPSNFFGIYGEPRNFMLTLRKGF